MLATCPTQDQLKSLTLGQLPEEQSDVLLLHLAGCQTCQDEISQIDESDDTFVRQIKSASELPDSDQPDEFETEKGCRVAVTRALAALAKSEEEGGQGNIPNVPDSIGEYDILRPLGAGGMGHVYLGQHTKLGRPVAIKFIADHRRWDRTMHERFESEMRTIGGLKHPNIVVAHDAREVDGLAVLVTEFIDGMTVGEILKRTGKLETADACKIAGAVCKALSYIDSQGIVHRDIKPSNIMIDADGSVKLLDLGLARLQAGNEMTGSPEFTATGQAMGTADYVAPEQVNDSRNVDIRADLYGLGCTLYKMLSGQAPFAGKHLTAFAKMNAHVSEVPESLGDKGVPTELANLVDKMLEKNPEDRVQSPDVVLSQVEKHSKNANLTALVAVARTMPELKPGSLADAPETSAPARPKAGGSFFTRYPWTTAIAGGLAAFALGVLFGIIITVKNLNGTTAQVNIPDGSIAIIDEQGNIEIQLSDSDRKLNIPNAQVENRQKDLPIANNIPTKPIPASSDIESDLLGGLLGSAAPSTATPADAIGVKNWFGAKDRPAQPSTTYLRQRDRIRRVEGYLEWTEWIRITSDSPVFGKVEQGDMVDVLTVSNGSDDGLTLPQILYSNRPVYDVKPSGQDFVISLNGRVKIPGNSASTVKVIVDFHDPERQARLDAVKLNGVWRTVLTRVGEKILEHDEKAMLILNNRAVSFYGGNAQSHRFKIENREGRNYFEIDGYRNLYRFLENGRLEVFSNPSGGRDTKTMVRYERVTEPVSETEKNAFEIIALNKQVANTFECYIVEDDDENKQEVPTGSKRLPFDGKEILLVGKPVITNQHVASAKVEADERGQPSLIIEMTGEGAARMGMATRRHLRKKMAIVIDGKVEMAPVINAVIYSSLELSGDFEAEEFANLRKAIVPKLRFPEGLGRYFHREQSQENIRTLMLAIHNYESAHKVFPLSSNITEKGGYPYSWRVALLPFLDRHDLFDQYDFKSPWDSEKNKKVLVQMPDVFRHPSFPIGSTTTNYVGISGGQGALGPKKENAKADNKGMGGMDDYGDGMGMMDGMGGMSGYGAESEVEKSLQQLRNTGFADVIDGSSNTVFLIESKANIPWTKPEDFPIESLLKEGKPDYQAIVKLRFLDESGLGVGFGDGETRVLDYAKIIPTSKTDQKRLSTLYQLFNVADGSTINPESLTINELKPRIKNK